MKTIWKFETPFEEKFTIKMPKSAEILCVQQDQKTFKPCIWAIVESENELEERYFELFGTGHPIHTDMGIEMKYLGTYQYEKGEYAGHIFERRLGQAGDLKAYFISNSRKEISIEYIQKIISDYLKIPTDLIQSKTRKRDVVQARQLSMYFAKKYTNASFASIGNHIGKRYHATVLHACKTVNNLSQTDKIFRTYVEEIDKKIASQS